MDIHVSERDDTVILALAGKLMGGPEAGQINDEINTLIDQDKKKIVIDLKRVEWMNSSGLGILIGTITTLKNNDGKLSLIYVSERINNLLRITKLQNVFSIYADLEEAIAEM